MGIVLDRLSFVMAGRDWARGFRIGADRSRTPLQCRVNPCGAEGIERRGNWRRERESQTREIAPPGDFDADPHAPGASKLLTGGPFAQIRIGMDTLDSIRREFGTATRMITYGLFGLTT
jgi:hypothetical protein